MEIMQVTRRGKTSVGMGVLRTKGDFKYNKSSADSISLHLRTKRESIWIELCMLHASP
jgi:hypothetical protein